MIANIIKSVFSKIKTKYYLAKSVDAQNVTGDIPYKNLICKNVMVGSVRNKTQFEYNLANNCYYVPACHINENKYPIEQIALLEDKNIGSSYIGFCGRIINKRLVKRMDIPVPMTRSNGEEMYFVFSVDEWKRLDSPIIVSGTYRGAPLYTSEFLLNSCSYSFHLFNINSIDEYSLAIILEKCKSSDRFCYRINGSYIQFKKGIFIVRKSDGEFAGRYSVTDYLKMPFVIFKKIKRDLKI